MATQEQPAVGSTGDFDLCLLSLTELLALSDAERVRYQHQVDRLQPLVAGLNVLTAAATPREKLAADSKLRGLPMTVKDNIDVRGFPTLAANPGLARELPERQS